MKPVLNNDITYIKAKNRLLSINFRELWQYRDLAILFVKRDLKNSYKQTVLGPLWIAINPLLSTGVFTLIFGIVAGIPTDGLPQFLFYMSGNILWSFFSNCLNRGAGTFLGNARLFGKVYFPRLIMPIAGILYNLINFLVQTALFVLLIVIYIIMGADIHPNALIALTPALILQTAMLGTGMGLIISSITTKYRDLNILVSFGVSLLMYITPVVYPASQIPESFRWLLMLNPVAPIVETYRCAFLGRGSVEWLFLLISLGVTLLVLFWGIVIFNRVEKNFIDTV